MTFDGERENTGVQLPAREAEILALAAKGLTDKQISAELGISRDTVSTYWRRILLRYKAANRTEVVARAVEAELMKKVNEAERFSARLVLEIHERSEAQANDLATRNLLVAVQTALVSFVSGSDPYDIFHDLLRELLSTTESEFGFISELALNGAGEPTMRNLAITNISWDDASKLTFETNKFVPCDRDTYSSILIESRMPLIANHPAGSSKSTHVPVGHSPINSFLGIPVINGMDMVGIVGVANRPNGYAKGMVEHLAPLVATCAAMIAGLKADQRRRQIEGEKTEVLARLHAVLNSLDSPVIMVDNGTIMRFVNDSFCKEFMPGLKPAEAIGLVARDLMNDYLDLFPNPEQYVERVNDILAAAETVRNEPVNLKDGRRFLRDFCPLWQGDAYLGHVWKFTKAR